MASLRHRGEPHPGLRPELCALLLRRLWRRRVRVSSDKTGVGSSDVSPVCLPARMAVVLAKPSDPDDFPPEIELGCGACSRGPRQAAGGRAPCTGVWGREAGGVVTPAPPFQLRAPCHTM